MSLRMERWSLWAIYVLLWVNLGALRLELGVCVNGDDSSSLSNANRGDALGGEGGGFSLKGRVESLNGKRATLRSLLQTGGKNPRLREPNGNNNENKDEPSPPPPPPSPPPQFSSLFPAPIPLESEGPTKLSSAVIASISIVGTICLLVLLSVAYLLWHRTKKDVPVIPWATGLSGKLQKAFVTGTPSLRRSELEEACEDFSNIIGSLSNCALYKGTLSSGVEIAVTYIDAELAENWSEQCQEQYRNKISVLSRVNHKNFMNLLGYCEEEEPFTRMMVFEYTPNGTLFEHLHIKEAEPLDWTARLRVAMGIAYCLEHIETLRPAVTLKNLNSSCIYLSDDYAAKISDLEFWTEEQLQKDVSQGSNRDNIVYKFSIILLEIISGRRPFSEDDGLLVLWASSYLDGKRPLMDMVDQSLTSVNKETIVALTDIVRSCVNEDLSLIPTMKEVVGRMRQITNITPEQANPRLTPIWWSEIEIISQ